MKPEAKRRFELEALEPRVLLSGDGLVAVAGSALNGATGSFQSPSQLEVQHDPSSGPMFSDQLEYAPSGQTDDIFAGMTDEKSEPSAPASDRPADTSAADDSGEELTAQTPVTSAEIRTTEGAAVPSNFSSASSAADSLNATSESSHPQTKWLTDTLRASNAPPSNSADSSVFTMLSQSFLLQSSASAGGAFADFTSFQANNFPLSNPFTLNGTNGSDTLHLRANGDKLERSSTGVEGSFSDDLDPDTDGVQSFTLTPGSNILVELNQGDDTLFIDGSLTAALDKLGASLVFDGNSGNDTLVGPASDTTWNVTGPNAGNVASITFSNVENLSGAADNQDTFLFEGAGTISGLVDGGAGGYDILGLASGTFDTVRFTITGPQSGTIRRDGDLITYAGLEPTTDNTGGDKVFDGTNGDDTITISDSGANELTIDIGVGEDATFTNASAITSVTVNGLNGNDTIVLNALDGAFNGSLTINAGHGSDSITLNAKTGSGTYTIDGGGTGGDTDTIVVTRDASMTLTDTQLTVGSDVFGLSGIGRANLTGGGGTNTFTITGWTGSGTLDGAGGTGDTVALTKDVASLSLSSTSLTATSGPTMTLSGIEVANLTGGSGDNSFTVQNWAGKAANLAGSTGADTYNFGNSWGNAVITDAGGGTIGFSAFTGTLKFYEPSSSPSSPEIEGIESSVVTGTINYDPSVSFTIANSDVPNKANLTAGLTALAGVLDRIEDAGKLNQPLFILDDHSIGDLFDLGGTLRSLMVTPVSGTSSSSLPQILAALNAVTGISATGTKSGGSIALDISINYSATIQNIDLNLGDPVNELVQTDHLRGSLPVLLQWGLHIDQTSGGTFTVSSTSDLQVHANVEKSGFTGYAGFLALDFSTPSLVFLDADVTVATNAGLSGGKSTSDLQAAGFGSGFGQSGNAYAKVDLTGGSTVSGVSVSNLSSSGTISLTGSSTGTKLDSTSLAGTFNLFSGATPTFATNLNAAPFSNFYIVTAGEIQGNLSSFADFLDSFSAKALAIGLPLSANGNTLAKILDLGNEFRENFLSLLQVQALLSSTSLSTLNNGGGVRTVSGTDLSGTDLKDLHIVLADNTTSFDVDLGGVTTLGGVATAIANAATAAGAGSHFDVRISTRNGALALIDRTGGTHSFQVSALNGSLAAKDLGLLSPGALQFDEKTLLKDLNNGAGIRTISGTDFTVTVGPSGGTTTFNVNLDPTSGSVGNLSLGDVMQKIRDAAKANGLAEGAVEVTLDTTNRRLIITDKTGSSAASATINSTDTVTDLKINASSGNIGAPLMIAQDIGYPGPNYATVQQLAAIADASSLVTVDTVSYDSTGPTIKFRVAVTLGGASDAVSDLVKLFDFGAFQDLVMTNSASLTLTPSGTLTLPFEVKLTPVGSGFTLTENTPVRDLNRGVGVQTVAGQNDIQVKLSNGTSFNVNLDHDPAGISLATLNGGTGIGTDIDDNDLKVRLRSGDSFEVDLDAGAAASTIADVVSKLNAAAAAANLDATKFEARADAARGSLVLIDHTTGSSTFAVTVPSGSSATTRTRLGLNVTAQTKLLGGTMQHFIESSFFTLGDLLNKIRTAATTAPTSLSTAAFEVRIGTDNRTILLIDGTGGTAAAFEVVALNDSVARRDLGLVTSGSHSIGTQTLISDLNRTNGVRTSTTSSDDDIHIVLRDGSSFDVDLDSITASTTVGDLLSRIQTAANSAFGSSQNKFRTGANPANDQPALFDLTTGGTTFAVTDLNSGHAVADLGLSSAVDGTEPGGLTAKVITLTSATLFLQGGPLDGDTSSSHIGVRGATLSASIAETASGIAAAGLWGPVAVTISGGSAASSSTTFATTFVDTGTDTLDEVASLRELRRGLAEVTDLLAPISPATSTIGGTLNLSLPLTITPAFGSLTGPATLNLAVSDIFSSTPPTPTFNQTNTTTDFLTQVRSLTMDEVMVALQQTADYLETSQNSDARLAHPLPGLNRSLGQLLPFGTQFKGLLATLTGDVPSSLQALQTALDGLADVGTVTLTYDTLSSTRTLGIAFSYSPALTGSQRFHLDLAALSLTSPTTLQSLGLDTIGGVVDLTGSTPVEVTTSGTVSLHLGINLETSADHAGFVRGDSSMSFNLRAVRSELNFPTLFGARTVDIVGGSFTIDSDGSDAGTSPATYAVDVNGGATTRNLFVNPSTHAVNPISQTTTMTGAVNATLPVHYPPQLNQLDASVITLAITNLNSEATTTTLSVTGPNVRTTIQTALNGNIDGLRAGFKELFRLLDVAFDATVFSRELPLVGTGLVDAADFLLQIRDKVGDNFDLITGILTPEKARQALFDAFGPGGLNWLQDRTTDSDTLVNIEDVSVTDTSSSSTGSVVFDLNLAMPQQLLAIPVDLDLILPGLGLKIDAKANVLFGFTTRLKFGISSSNGVFLDKSFIDDLAIKLDVTLPTPADATGFKSWMGLLPYRVLDNSSTPTALHGIYDFALNRASGRLTYAELVSAMGGGGSPTQLRSPAEAILLGGFSSTAADYTTAHDVDIHLKLQTDLPAGTALPSYQMDLDITGWRFTSTINAGASLGTGSTTRTESTGQIAFDHTKFELVSFVRDFIGSAMVRLREAFAPMDGIVDFLNSEAFPFVSLVFGRAPYMSARSFDGGAVEVGNFAGASLAIRRMVEGGQLVGEPSNPFGIFGVVPFSLMPAPPGDILSNPTSPAALAYYSLLGVGPIAGLTGTRWIDIGSSSAIDFTIDFAQARQPLPVGVTNLAPQNVHARAFGNPDDAVGTSILSDIAAIAGDTTVASGIQDAALDFLATQFLPGRGKYEGFFGGAIRLLLGVGIDPVLLPLLNDATAKDSRHSFDLIMGDILLGDSTKTPETASLMSYKTPELFLYLYQDIPLSTEQVAEKIMEEGDILGVLTKFSAEIQIYLAVAFETRADFGLGFDTTGLKTFARTHNPGDIVNGLYFDKSEGVEKNGPNTAKATGSDKYPDQMRMLGGVGFGLQLVVNLSIIQFKVGIELLTFLGSAWNFHDVDSSDGLGRVRANEFDVNDVPGKSFFDQNFVIEIRADVFFKLSVGISIFRFTIFDIRFNLGTTTFDIPLPGQSFDTLPTLGTVSGGILTLSFTGQPATNKVYYLGAGDNDGEVYVSTTISRSFTFTFLGITLSFTRTYTVTQLFKDVTQKVYGSTGGGNDTIYVTPDLKTLVEIHAGAGNDTLVAGGGRVLFYGDAGADVLIGGPAGDDLNGGDDADTIYGGDGRDTINGDAGADTIYGERGDDTILGGTEADLIYGGSEADTIGGGDGADTVYGGPGNDSISGDAGVDVLWGNDGRDTIHGGAENDTLHGDLGNDTLYGDGGDDTIFGDANNDTLFGGSNNDRLDGGGASDIVFGDNGQPNPVPSDNPSGPNRDVIISGQGNDFLDGQDDSDTYLITYQGGKARSLIYVLDTGSVVGTDLFVVTGTIFDDDILLRANTDGSLAFVAELNDADNVERINYSGVERIVVNGSFGNDHFVADDTAAEVTINGEFGDDTFQIGQLFRSPRTNVAANVSVDDEFATIETTRGFLSNGISAPMTINGGEGSDHFVVFHNLAVLTLNGDNGDDVFEIRAFALSGSQEPRRARTDISGGAGADLVQYAVNAPVNIDGGDGFDTVVVIGTEFADDLVITNKGVFGAGLNVNFVNIESLRVDGAEGDDRFFVESTSETFFTEIFGGLGSDTFFMSGDTPPIVSNDLLGHSGIVTHGVESTDSRYAGQKLFGVSANVADNDEPGIVILPSDGSTIIAEGGQTDSYQVVLTRAPVTEIIVKALAPLPTPDERELRARAFSLSSTAPGAVNSADGTSVSLKFTATNWYIPQTVTVAALSTPFTDAAGLLTRPELGDSASFNFDDNALEGVRFGVINHLVLANVASVTGTLAAGTVTTVKSGTEARIQITGTPATGDSFSVSINGTQVAAHTTTSGQTIAQILDALWGDVVGTPPAGITATRMIQDTLTLSGGVDVGDQFTVTIGSTAIIYTVPASGVSTLAQVASGLALAVNAANLTGVSADDRAGNGTFTILAPVVVTLSVANPVDPDSDSNIQNTSQIDLLILSSEDGDLTTDNSTDFSVSDTSSASDITIRVDGSAGATTLMTNNTGLTSGLIGRKLIITSGPGAGQQRFITGVLNNSLVTVNRPWNVDDVPTFQSTFLVRVDDALVSRPTAVNNTAFTFTDTARAAFPTAGQGLTGRILQIVGGPGAGQQRLILSNTGTTLTLNGAWRIQPTTESVYRVELFDGLAIPSVLVQINDNDQAGIIVTQTGDGTAVIEGGDGFLSSSPSTAQAGEKDSLQIQLTSTPSSAVTVTLTNTDGQLSLSSSTLTFSSTTAQTVTVSAVNDAVREGLHTGLIQFSLAGGNADATASQTDTFTISALDAPSFFVGLSRTPLVDATHSVTVTVNGVARPAARFAIVGNKIVFLRENATFPSSDLEAVVGTVAVSYTYRNPGFAAATTKPVLVRIADDDAPTVLVRESGGSTDVIEVKTTGSDPETILPTNQNTNQSPWIDFYELVLTGQPAIPAGQTTGTVTITVTPEITKTTRTGGIRHDAVQVALSKGDPLDSRVVVNANGTLTVTFSSTDWDKPVQVKVSAVDDAVVDGSDTQVFAPHPNTLSGILGPIRVEGGGGGGSLILTSPALLPDETNVKPSTGTVVDLSGNQLTVLTADLNAVLSQLGLASPSELVGRTVEVTKPFDSPVIGQFRLITAVAAGQSGQTVLTLNAGYFNGQTALTESQVTEYAITSESLNFFVNESQQVDVMFVHDEDSPADSSGVLTSTRLFGLNMGPDLFFNGTFKPGGITYGELEVVQINLGPGINNFTVLGTPRREDGFQTWTMLNTGSDIPNPQNPTVTGDTVLISLKASEVITVGDATLHPALLSGASLTDGRSTLTFSGTPFAGLDLRGQIVRIGDGQERRILSHTGSTLTLDRVWETIPNGSQSINVVKEADGSFAVNTEGGADTVNASGSTLPLVIFGGLGNDTINGGSGGDVIFGDRGRVDYLNEAGAIVTRLGTPPDLKTATTATRETEVFGTVTGATTLTLTDSLASFPTTEGGLAGLFVDITLGTGALQRRRIVSNTATQLTLSASWDTLPVGGTYRIYAFSEDQTDGVRRGASLLLSVDPSLGGADTINAAAGDDQVFGGIGNDVISAGANNDVVVGDAGQLDRSRDPNAPAQPGLGASVGSLFDRLRTIALDQGGNDTLAGNAGADILLGGQGGDTIYGDDSTASGGAADLADVLLGDNGEIDFDNGIVRRIFTTDLTTATGSADTISGNANADVILGGLNGSADTLYGDAATPGANDGNDLILGDNGELNFAYGSDTNLATLDLVRSYTDGLGGADTISGNAGQDTVLGGSGGDTIYGNNAAATSNATDGADLLIGDNADILLGGSVAGNLFIQGSAVKSIASTDTAEATGGADTISGNSLGDVILGGVYADTLYGDANVAGANDGNDLILGDNGELNFAYGSDTNLATLDLIRSYTDGRGGADTISGNAGSDSVLGGSGGDTIYGNNAAATSNATDGADLLIGDNADILLGGSVAGNLFIQGSAVKSIASTDTTETTGGADTITGNSLGDVMLGGVNGDTLYGDAASTGSNDLNDIVVGDNATLLYDVDSDLSTLVSIQTLPFASGGTTVLGGLDTISGNAGSDILIGGTGGDTLFGDDRTGSLGSSDSADFIVGDQVQIDFTANVPTRIVTTTRTTATAGGADLILGNYGEDILVGGSDSDRIDGNGNDDLIFGDNVEITRRAAGIIANLRFETLSGTRIYSRTDLDGGLGEDSGQALVDDVARNYRNQNGPVPYWAVWVVTDLDHSAAIETAGGNRFGNDYIAGGPGNDVILGQLGDDTIQGDGSIESAIDTDSSTLPVAAQRVSPGPIALTPTLTATSIGTLQVTPSFEATSDGDDYIEGGGGSDVIFGNLGQDDIIGGSSSLFSLTTAAQRPDGNDLIFGGAGTAIGRNAEVPSTGGNITFNQRHARDADVIAGDNANIYRLVGVNGTDGGAFLQFNYDQSSTFEDRGSLRIIPRAVRFLNYTPGGPSYDAAANNDLGGPDEVHGESGDDTIYGMKGNDVLFGDSDDDDLIGGWGNEWISGGTGQDGALGDDGRIFTSRNTKKINNSDNALSEPLYGIAKLDAVDLEISTPGKIQDVFINANGQLKKTVDLTPFNLTPKANSTDDPLNDPTDADDIIYGGLGGDFLHGGAGDDAISGAEALSGFFAAPANPGNVLRFDATKEQFADYDEYQPLRRMDPFLLNFDAAEGPAVTITGYATVHTDGNDVLFGDLGNDWTVGGTGKDHLFGGWGDDLLNGDDDLTTGTGANDTPDTNPSYEDIAFGGAGRDVLMGNTGGDRLIDWTGEFNSFLVSFAPFGTFTISRAIEPQLYQYLYDLSKSDGADPTRGADAGNAARNGEPDGEIGLITKQDSAWQAQTGAPADPQPGNIPGGGRDVLRGADFNNGTTAGFAPDSGTWQVSSGALQVSATSPQADAVAVYHVGDALPAYFEVRASIEVIKPTGGWKANAYLIFDYQSRTDFKFAGMDVATNQLVMGHRDATGWVIDKQAPFLGSAQSGTFYNMLLAVNGLTASLVIDNTTVFTNTFAARVVDGSSYGLNWGLVGVGSDRSRGAYDNIAVQVLPPQITYSNLDDFSDGVADLFTAGRTGTWWDPLESTCRHASLSIL